MVCHFWPQLMLFQMVPLTGFFVRNPSKSLQRKCGTRQFLRFENEFQHFENEFQLLENEFLSCKKKFGRYSLEIVVFALFWQFVNKNWHLEGHPSKIYAKIQFFWTKFKFYLVWLEIEFCGEERVSSGKTSFKWKNRVLGFLANQVSLETRKKSLGDL